MGPVRPKIRLLLIEDDAMSRELWAFLLEAEGYQVRAVDSGEMALAEIDRSRSDPAQNEPGDGGKDGPRPSWRPDVVLMDMQLPGLSGAGLAAALRSACAPRHQASASPPERDSMPEVMVFAMSGSEPRGVSALVGCDGFLLKPFSMEALAEHLTRALESRQSSAQRQITLEVSSASPEATAPGEAPAPGQATTLALDPGVLDSVTYDKLAASMSAETLSALYTLCLRDVRVRIDAMRLAAVCSDELAYQRQAHAIKGACGMLGATVLASVAQAMEADGLAPGAAAVTARAQAIELACEHLERILVTNTRRS